ncbi:C-type lectin domain family 2 member B-like [Rhinoderma darwinii]|uniref:C-type lectin domain family 2 member B-like n=1 Tax=Rhinoderma darwinii TaxID=43563 RepID=UPI003F6812AB
MIVVAILKVVEVSALLIIVQKNSCNTTTEDSGQNFQDETKEFDLNISKKYIDAYNAITDLCAATGQVCELCPLNWDAFNGKCYFFSEERYKWAQSENNCEQRNAELISFENMEEQDFISRHIPLKNGHFWIGLTKHESHWQWKRGGQFQGKISVTSEEHQCATYGKDLSAESCFNPNKWICKKNMTRL